MSEISKMIEELCPEGVEYKKLCEITHLNAGERITKAMMGKENKYPVMGGGMQPTGFYSEFNSKKSIAISRAGSAGYVNWMENKFWATDVCFIAEELNKNFNIKYIYYCVKNKQHDLQSKTYGGNLPKLNKDYLWNLEIPVPPLPIQEKIVEILDKFTELEAELEARRSQYEFYRDSLLHFDKVGGVKLVRLGDVANRLKGSPITATQMKTMFVEGGHIKLFGGGATMITTNEFYTKDFTIIKEPSVLVKSRGIIDVEYCEEPYTFKQEMWAYKGKKELNNKYLYYILQTNLDLLRKKGSQMGSMPQIKIEDTEDLIIPLPALSVQEKIVEVLDNFDKVCNDLNIGLPAEIEARKQQYEWYRDNLLTFVKSGNIIADRQTDRQTDR